LEALGSPLAGLSRSTPYAVPEGYFASLERTLAKGVIDSGLEDPELRLPETMPYAIPEEYFALLPARLTALAAAHEGSATPNVPFDVPPGYFDSLPAALLHTAREADVPRPAGRTIAFRPQWQKRILQLAAAAAVVLGIGIATYRYTQPAPAPETVAVARLGELSPEIIGDYVALHVDEFDLETLDSSLIASGSDLSPAASGLAEQEIQQYFSDEGSVDSERPN